MLTEIKELITVTKMGPIIINLDSKIQEIIYYNQMATQMV
jgi:hypothetical protein